jgi:catechol 2,3-dioxygenase-like lactoylglutathione lyase family enzyme
MRFRWTIIYVADVTATIEFYERAFGFTRRFISGEGGYGEIETGDTRLGFAAIKNSENALPGGVAPLDPAGQPQAAELGFVADDVGAGVKQAVDAGASLISEPKEMPWGQTVAYVRDLNGVLVEIASDMA